MPAHKSAVKSEPITMVLPVAVREQMEQHLFDPEKGRVPKGAISTYIANLIKRDLSSKPASAGNGVADLSDLFNNEGSDYV